jgi:hypothetical protein
MATLLVQLSAVKTDGLAAAIHTGTALGCPTERSRHLLALARLAWHVRKSLLSGDWDTVESLLEASSGDVLGTTAPLPRGCDVPPLSAEEFALIRSEIDDRKVQQRLRSALSTGGPVGSIGHLNLQLLQVDGVEAALEFAVKTGAKSAAARQLVAAASLIRGLRRSLMACEWDMLGAIVDYCVRDSSVISVSRRVCCVFCACCVCRRCALLLVAVVVVIVLVLVLAVVVVAACRDRLS